MRAGGEQRKERQSQKEQSKETKMECMDVGTVYLGLGKITSQSTQDG